MNVSQILNQMTRQREANYIGDFISAKLIALRGIGLLPDLHQEMIWLAEQCGLHSTPCLDGRSYPFKFTRLKQHSKRSDKDWRWSQSTSHELWGRFCTCITCWETFSPKIKRAFDRCWLHSCKHKVQIGDVLSAGFHSNPNYWFLPRTNSLVFVSEIWRN